MNRKRILFVNHSESRTGAPKIVFEVARSLRADFEVVVLSMMKGSMTEEFRKTFGRVIYPEADLRNSAELQQIIRAVNPDLVYVNSMVAHQYAAASKSLGIPTIYHIHELGKAVKYCLDEEDVRRFHLCADLFIACSEVVERFLMNELNCEASRVRCIHEFVSASEVLSKLDAPSQDSDPEDEDGFGRGITVVGMGTADSRIQIRRKGLDFFIEASNLLKDKGFAFIWIGPYNEALIKDICPGFEGLGHNVRFVGYLENPFRCLNAADIFVLPSREDPFPLVVLEAMALGKPIVAFREGGGSPEAIADCCGLVVDEMSARALADSIAQLAKDKQLIADLSRSGPIKQGLHYDARVVIPRIKQLVEQTLSRPN